MSCFDVKIAKVSGRLRGQVSLAHAAKPGGCGPLVLKVSGRLRGQANLVCAVKPLDHVPFILKDGKALYTTDGKQFRVREK